MHKSWSVSPPEGSVDASEPWRQRAVGRMSQESSGVGASNRPKQTKKKNKNEQNLALRVYPTTRWPSLNMKPGQHPRKGKQRFVSPGWQGMLQAVLQWASFQESPSTLLGENIFSMHFNSRPDILLASHGISPVACHNLSVPLKQHSQLPKIEHVNRCFGEKKANICPAGNTNPPHPALPSCSLAPTHPQVLQRGGRHREEHSSHITATSITLDLKWCTAPGTAQYL